MSTKNIVTAAVLGAALLMIAPSGAQQTPPPNPLDAVPDKMPFDIPYGAPISLDRAEAAIAAVRVPAPAQTPLVAEVALSVGLLAATVPLVTWLAIRVFRAGVLLYGQPPTVGTFLRAVRHG